MRNAGVWMWLAVLALMGSGVAAAQEQRAAEVSVDPQVTHQTMEGFGACYENWIEPPCFRDPAWYDALVNDLGVSMVRIPVPLCMEPVNDDADPNHFNWPGFALGSAEAMPTERKAGPTDPLQTQLDRVMKVAMEFKKRGVTRFMASLWSPPAFMKTNRETVQGGHLRMDMTDEFAEYMAAFVILAKKNYDIDIGALSLQNELLFTEFYDSCVYSPEQLREAVRAVGRKFQKEGIRTRIMIPEDMMTVERMVPYVTPSMADPETRPFVGAFCTHRLGGFDEVSRWFDATKQYGLETWMTETSGHPNSWQGALRMVCDMNDYIIGGNMSAWEYWMLDDVGAMPGGKPGPKFAAARHFYKFVRPGAVRVDSVSNDAALLTSAFRHDGDGTLSIVLINRGDTPVSVAVKVAGKSVPDSYQVAQSSQSGIAPDQGPLAAGQLHLTMPAQSIVTLYGQSAALKTAAPKPWPASVDVPVGTEKWGNFDRTDLGVGYDATRAAEMNVLDALKAKIDAGQANATRTDGWTPLLWACLAGSSQSVKLLLDNGADVNKAANDGWTPLHEAAAAFQPDDGRKTVKPDAAGVQILQMLLAHGANVKAVTKDGWTPLTAAVANGFVGYRGDPQDRPARIKALLAAGADIEAADVNGRTPLHWAAWQGNMVGLDTTDTLVAVLIEAKANANAVDKLGRTPLHYAAEMGYDAIVKTLLAAGANTQARDHDGKTPADLARARQLASTVALLAETGTDAKPQK